MSDIKTADHGELIAFADHLVETGAFAGPGEVVYFFEKPWKWQEQFDAWKEPTWDTLEMGRWIANTEELYQACKGGSADWIAAKVHAWLAVRGEVDGFKVDLNLVDWTEVAP